MYRFMEGIGDIGVSSQHYHGTRDKRTASVEAGFAPVMSENPLFKDCYSRGKAYILRTDRAPPFIGPAVHFLPCSECLVCSG